MKIQDNIKIMLSNGNVITLSEIIQKVDEHSFRNRLQNENEQIYALRKLRYLTCFPIVDRSELWYNDLTDAQYKELKDWRRAWLDVTETMIVPVTPKWLNDKLEGDEIL